MPRALVVDDHPDSAESLALILELHGAQTAVRTDGASVLEAVRAFAPDLVVLDIGLPQISGLQLARLLRADPRHAGLKLVALSGFDTPEHRASALAAGFDVHFGKPLSNEGLAWIVGALGLATSPAP